MSRIYVGRLPGHASRRDVERFFRNYGRVLEIVMMRNYAFVEFDDCRDADDAVRDLNGRELSGSRVVVERTRLPPRMRRGRNRTPSPNFRRNVGPKYGPPQRTDHRIIVENLSTRISWQDLKDMMRKVGEVTFADAHMTKRNEGVVEFSSARDMKYAISKYDGYELYGRKLHVFVDRVRRSGSRSPSRSRSRSRSHRRRRSRSRSRRRSRSHRRRSSSPKRRSSPAERSRTRTRTRTRSRSRSASKEDARRSDSRGPTENGGDKYEDDERSPTRSDAGSGTPRSASRPRSRSRDAASDAS